MAPLGVSFYLLIQHQGRVLSAILVPLDSNQFMLSLGYVIFQKLCPAPFPPVTGRLSAFHHFVVCGFVINCLYFGEICSLCTHFDENFFKFNFILILNFTLLYWFCQISKWIRHRYTRVPHPEPSSLLPPHTIPLGCPSAPAPSIQYCASNLDWQLISYMILYMYYNIEPGTMVLEKEFGMRTFLVKKSCYVHFPFWGRHGAVLPSRDAH